MTELSPQPRRKPDLPTFDLVVTEAFDLHAGLRRVIFEAPAFAYRPGQDLVLLLPLGNGETGRRHYTIRTRDEVGRIAIDFVMHGKTPGPEFARNARPGDRITARGPRGRSWLRAECDWHLILCDETGLPAALHIIETAPTGTRLILLAEVQDDSWKVPVPAFVQADWLLRHDRASGPNSLLLDRLADLDLPKGRGFAILMGETSNVRGQRHWLLAHGFEKDRIASEGYWRPGRLGGHDHVEDE